MVEERREKAWVVGGLVRGMGGGELGRRWGTGGQNNSRHLLIPLSPFFWLVNHIIPEIIVRVYLAV